jgi:hypothetical protein
VSIYLGLSKRCSFTWEIATKKGRDRKVPEFGEDQYIKMAGEKNYKYKQEIQQVRNLPLR